MRRRAAAATLALIALAAAGCAAVGPASLSSGRTAYNEVINRTEDEQVLAMIVRQRYDETFGMLAVTSVTASLRVEASVGANVGIGPRSGYEGNLVPLSAGAAYEENPAISYVPVRGEQFVERMLAPLSAEQALLLARMSTDELEVLPLLIRRANGIANPLYASRPGAGEESFGRFVGLYAALRERGRLDIVRDEEDGAFELMIHDHTEQDVPMVRELLGTLGIEGRTAPGEPITVPLRFFVGSPRTRGLDLETPSALEVLQAAAAGVQVPDEHVASGIARRSERAGFITIRASDGRPSSAAVAVRHRGSWFYIDGRDTRSKQAFMFLRTLIGLRLDEAASDLGSPVLTVPVAR